MGVGLLLPICAVLLCLSVHMPGTWEHAAQGLLVARLAAVSVYSDIKAIIFWLADCFLLNNCWKLADNFYEFEMKASLRTSESTQCLVHLGKSERAGIPSAKRTCIRPSN